MKFNGRREFGHRALTVLCRIGLLIWCNKSAGSNAQFWRRVSGSIPAAFSARRCRSSAEMSKPHTATTAVLSPTLSSAEFFHSTGDVLRLPDLRRVLTDGVELVVEQRHARVQISDASLHVAATSAVLASREG